MTITQDYLVANQHYIIDLIKEDEKGKMVNVIFIIPPVDKSVNDENGNLVFRFDKVPLQLRIRYQYVTTTDVNLVLDGYVIRDISPKDVFSAPTSYVLNISSNNRFIGIKEAVLISWSRT